MDIIADNEKILKEISELKQQINELKDMVAEMQGNIVSRKEYYALDAIHTKNKNYIFQYFSKVLSLIICQNNNLFTLDLDDKEYKHVTSEFIDMYNKYCDEYNDKNNKLNNDIEKFNENYIRKSKK